jgi:G3E family GTPase
VIETTGLAAPAPVAQTFLVDRLLLARTTLDSVTAVVDACHVRSQIAHSREAAEQIAFADQVVLNKCDLVDAATLVDVEARLRGLNPDAPVQRTQRASLDVASLIGRGSFDLARLGDAVECTHSDCDHDHASVVHEVSAIHHDDVRSVSLRTDHPLDMDRLQQWLESLLQRDGDRVLRTKGLLCIAGDERRFVVQAVHRLVEGDWQRAWRGGEVRSSRLVFIGRGLDAGALQTALEGCVASVQQGLPEGRIQRVWPH